MIYKYILNFIIIIKCNLCILDSGDSPNMNNSNNDCIKLDEIEL